MNGTTIHAPVDMRDIRALRNDLVEVSEEASRQTLAAHTRTLAVIAANEASAKEHRADLLGELAEIRTQQKAMLAHLERLVDVPATDRVTAPPSTWQERAGAWLARPASTRALLYGLAVAGIGATLSGGLAQPLARVLLLGSP